MVYEAKFVIDDEDGFDEFVLQYRLIDEKNTSIFGWYFTHYNYESFLGTNIWDAKQAMYQLTSRMPEDEITVLLTKIIAQLPNQFFCGFKYLMLIDSKVSLHELITILNATISTDTNTLTIPDDIEILMWKKN